MSTRQIVNSVCPLCSADADYYDIDYGERHYFKCPTCTKFIVTNQAEQHLREVASVRNDLSQAAQDATKSNDERVLEIRFQRSGPDGVAALQVNVVEKKNYPSI